ncbi:uncharacterized protein LOC121404116 [Drosophila obscura]|uniref:uncharacterized protein LOC121404116 n=1 Tax=Drosophila obscura TaxID=7282 RepID=UPI001BB1EAF5|nr:uncharacterized protein LOC121404116 [Drosophila obscura]
MGAKNSKQQAEKSGKRSSNETNEHKKEAEQQEVPPLKPPGSPRQAKVIVHRIVRAEDEPAKGEGQPLEQQQPNTSQDPKAEEAIVPEIQDVAQRNESVPVAQGTAAAAQHKSDHPPDTPGKG